MPAKEISLKEAKQNKLFYFVANVVVYRESDKRCLILKRSESEKVHPGKWAVTGGKLEWEDLDLNKPSRLNGDVLDFEDAIEKLLSREAEEEANVKIKGPLVYVNDVAFVRPDGIPVILVKFGAKYVSGDVKVEEGAFTDYAWVNSDEIKNFDCIDGLEYEVSYTIKAFSN